MSEYILRPGGLMRCCMDTLRLRDASDALKREEGERITCFYCKHPSIIFRDGAYEWTGEVDGRNVR